ncbi:MAG: 23S rRNA (uracil(1939)-C(5))-methyltransferase RlmD [Bacteroidia bacterium]
MARKKKQQFYDKVELLAGGGEGHAIAKVDGKVIFVKYGAPGDVADIKIIGRKKRFSLARVETLHNASEVRQEAFCKHYGVCGGCRWQHINYEEQLKLKDQWAKDCMQRIGKLEVEAYEDILGAEQTEFYRNKMEYTFSNKRWLYEGENAEEMPHLNALGFHAPGRFDKVVEIEKCWLQADTGNQIRNYVQNYCLEHDLAFYDLKTHEGLVRNLMLRNTVSGDWMLTLFVTEFNEGVKDLLESVNSEFEIHSLNYAVNTKRNDSIFDLEIINYKGSEFISEKLQGLSFEIHPKSFFQTNTKQADKLYDVALDFAGITGEDVVYDLYCGTGTLTLSAASKAKKAIGAEIVDEAIASAKRNALVNKVDNSHFVVGDMKDVFNQEFYEEHGMADIIITDPPRSGMHPKVVKRLLEIKCPKVVYVSCNPATQARDLQELSEVYRIVKSRAVDMFPHTHHVENVVLLQLK